MRARERWYADSLRVGGRALPVTVARLAIPPTELIRVGSEPAPLDEQLAGAGRPHLDEVRRRSPGMFDGPVVAMTRIGDRLDAAPSSYFAMIATCDALRAEAETNPDAELDALPLRQRAHELAGGTPLSCGAGRCAAIGVSIVTTVPHGRTRAVIVGRRAAGVAADAGMWHVAPSGMVEPDGLVAAVQRELAEELGVRLSTAELTARLTTLGIAHDLARLRPDVCLRLDLDDVPPRVSAAPGGDEFATLRLLPLDVGHRSAEPDLAMTPAGLGALALLRDQ